MNQYTSPWTQVEKDLVPVLWDDGLSASEIGKKIGKTRAAVLGHIDRLRKAGVEMKRPKAPRFVPMTARQEAEAKRLYSTVGLSVAAISRELGIGRDYLYDFIRRAGWPKYVAPPVERIREVRAQREARPEPTPRLRKDPFVPLPFSEPRPWLERAPMTCKWPVGGEGADLIMCCRLAPSNVYCNEHAAIAFVPTSRKVPTEPSFRRRAA